VSVPPNGRDVNTVAREGTMASTATAAITKSEAIAEDIISHEGKSRGQRVDDLDSAPLALTDDQLTQIMRHAGVLHRGLRRAFVERVAFELRGQVVGDGLVFRACAKVLKESGMFDPPDLDSGRMPRVGKWDR
jgi:hypothetical protein